MSGILPRMQLSFERATDADVMIFLALEEAAGDARLYSPVRDRVAALREIACNRLSFIRCDGERVGTVAFRRESAGSVYISNVAVQPFWRRRGIARAAMEFVEAENGKASVFTLVTHPDNTPALALYLSLGFTVEGRQENTFGDGEPRLLLVKRCR